MATTNPYYAQWQNWFSTCGFTFPLLHDELMTVRSQYNVTGIPDPGHWPDICIIGRDMILRKGNHGGVPDEATLEGMLLDVLYMRDPIDLEMVMDVSDSMNSPATSDPSGDTKLAMMKQASKIITDLLHDHGQQDDRMGLVWFTDNASEYIDPIGQKLLSVANCGPSLKIEIDAHTTGNCTAMGAGLQIAFNTLVTRPDHRFAIVCTDGMQNIEPKVTQVGNHFEICDFGGWECGGHSSTLPCPGYDIAEYSTPVQTIGIGIEATYASLLQDLANTTDGFYRGTNDPDVDLDLMYYVDLCNCMAGDSPAVVCHRVGRLTSEKNVDNVYFNLNRSVRKFTTVLSWKQSQQSSLTFWLYNPSGTMVPLQQALRHYDTYTMATLYLPTKLPDANEHVGRWRMLITGEMSGPYADYHATVMAEDRDVKLHLEYPKQIYSVGDILPVRIRVEEQEKVVRKITELVVETAQLAEPLAEMMAEFRVSDFEIRRMTSDGTERTDDGFLLKLRSMTSNHTFQKRFKPVREVLSLQEGTIRPMVGEREMLIPFELKQAGLLTLKVMIQAETPENGPIQRVDVLSVLVDPGQIDLMHTTVVPMERSAVKRRGVLLRITPRNSRGQLLGPGQAKEFEALAGEKVIKVEAEDLLDGSYEVELLFPEQEWIELKRKHAAALRLMFQKMLIWE